MKRVRSTGLILITAGLLLTSGPTWATGDSLNRFPVRPESSAATLSAALDAVDGWWDSVVAGFQSLLGDGALTEKSDTSTDPDPQDTSSGGPGPILPPPGGGCIDPNGNPVNVYPCPY